MARNGKDKVLRAVTQAILEALEKGTVPWQKPWVGGGSRPVNHVQGYPYRGINAVVLPFVALARGYQYNRWITLNQAKKAGLWLEDIKGASVPVLFSKPIHKRDENDEIVSTYWHTRYTRVFNIDHIRDLEWEPPDLPNGVTPHDEAEQVFQEALEAGRLPRVDWGGDRAAYSPFADVIQVPTQAQFKDTSGYYGTLYHEIVHSTGHDLRIGRVLNTNQSSPEYKFEETIAQMGACMFLNMFGIDEKIEESADYMAGWLPEIRKDPGILTRAASEAQGAMDWVLGEHRLQKE